MSSRGATPTIHDVAALAGVSITTVSRVLNRTPGTRIHAATRDRIERAARHLGYRPNHLARGLRSRHTQTLGFLTDHLGTAPHAGKLIQGIQQAAESHDRLLIALDSGGHTELRARQTQTLLDRRVDGIIFAAMRHQELAPPTSARQVPVVLLNAFCERDGYPSVVPDQHQGAELAVRELLRHGHRAIAFVTDAPSTPAGTARLEGYRTALTAAAIRHEADWVIRTTAGTVGGFNATTALLQLPAMIRPTALVCLDDLLAMGAYQAADEHGLRIPDDLSIIGFDDHELIAASLRPTLTTIALPLKEMGAWAVHALLAPEPPDRHLSLPCHLVRGGSVSTPAAGAGVSGLGATGTAVEPAGR